MLSVIRAACMTFFIENLVCLCPNGPVTKVAMLEANGLGISWVHKYPREVDCPSHISL
jgi:hypothetical protein